MLLGVACLGLAANSAFVAANVEVPSLAESGMDQVAQLQRLNAEVTKLTQEREELGKILQAQENQAEAGGNANTIHLSIRYPGAEAPPQPPAAEEPAPSGAGETIFTPLMVLSPEPLIPAKYLMEKFKLEAEALGSRANEQQKSLMAVRQDPQQEIKILEAQIKEFEKKRAYHEGDKAASRRAFD